MLPNSWKLFWNILYVFVFDKCFMGMSIFILFYFYFFYFQQASKSCIPLTRAKMPSPTILATPVCRRTPTPYQFTLLLRSSNQLLACQGLRQRSLGLGAQTLRPSREWRSLTNPYRPLLVLPPQDVVLDLLLPFQLKGEVSGFKFFFSFFFFFFFFFFFSFYKLIPLPLLSQNSKSLCHWKKCTFSP